MQVELAQPPVNLLPRADTPVGTHLLAPWGGGRGARGGARRRRQLEGSTAARVRGSAIAQLRRRPWRDTSEAQRRAGSTATSGARVPFPTLALVRLYTNSGKVDAHEHAFTAPAGACWVEDRLFATLDPTIRKLRLPEGPDRAPRRHGRAFIHKLPPPAGRGRSRGTLRGGAGQRTLLIHVVDVRAPPTWGRGRWRRGSRNVASGEIGAARSAPSSSRSTRSTCCGAGQLPPGAGPERDPDLRPVTGRRHRARLLAGGSRGRLSPRARGRVALRAALGPVAEPDLATQGAPGPALGRGVLPRRPGSP